MQLARYPGDGRGYVRHRDTPGSALESEEAERKVCLCVVSVRAVPTSVTASAVCLCVVDAASSADVMLGFRRCRMLEIGHVPLVFCLCPSVPISSLLLS